MSVAFYGDYDTTETVNIPFNTFTSDDPSASSTITDLAAGDIEIHKDGSTTQRSSDNGVTVSINFDSVTGNHMVHIDLSDNSDAGFYSAGSRYAVRMEGTTVDGATINAWIGAFSIGCTLRPTVDGRTLDVTTTGAAGIDWGNVENQTTSVDLSATAIDLCDEVTIGGGLSGSNPVTLTIQDENSNNIVECAVEIWDSAGTTFYERKTTDSGGQTTHNLDDGTYTIKLHKSGYSFDDETLVVDGTEAETYTGTSYTFPAVPDAGNCILYTKFEDYKSDDISDLTATLKIVSLPHYSGNGAFHESQSIDITYNSVTKVGYWEVVDGARVKLYSTQLGLNHYLTVTADENGYMLFDDDDLETIER